MISRYQPRCFNVCKLQMHFVCCLLFCTERQLHNIILTKISILFYINTCSIYIENAALLIT